MRLAAGAPDAGQATFDDPDARAASTWSPPAVPASEKLARGRPLTVKVGFDPTAPDIHLGHTVLIRKMKHFQDLGHRVIFVIGDFTGHDRRPDRAVEDAPAAVARGDRGERRDLQAAGLQDPRSGEDRDPLQPRVAGRARLGRLRPAGRRPTTSRACSSGATSGSATRRASRSRVHEFLYPLAQAYDSVALEADVELGGTDQLFNLNVGRDIMPAYGLEPQVVMTTPLLEGTDGVEKMSKSLGNYIGVTEAPDAMFAKVMSDLRRADVALLPAAHGPRRRPRSSGKARASSPWPRRWRWRAGSSRTSTAPPPGRRRASGVAPRPPAAPGADRDAASSRCGRAGTRRTSCWSRAASRRRRARPMRLLRQARGAGATAPCVNASGDRDRRRATASCDRRSGPRASCDFEARVAGDAFQRSGPH